MVKLISFKTIFHLGLKGLNFTQSHFIFTSNGTPTDRVTTKIMCKRCVN